MAKLSPAEVASRFLRRPHEKLDDVERQIIADALEKRVSARDQTGAYTDSLGDRLADGIARVGGSWTFIIGFLVFLGVWALLNAWLLGRDAFDPYPFIFLNLVLSMLAALQAPVIMMSQNRAAERDRIDARHDYEVNLKAELEILGLHEKLDALRAQELELIRMELQKTTQAIADLQQKLGSNVSQ